MTADQEPKYTLQELAAAIKYPLLSEDLQIILQKYAPLKTAAETAEVFEALLTALPYLDDPAENLSLAVKVILKSDAQTLQEAQNEAQKRKDKLLYMRQLLEDKYLAPGADELTLKFFGAHSPAELAGELHKILKQLPTTGDIYENADIALKVLLQKLPLKDAANQAAYQKENKAARQQGEQAAFALEQEAYEGYLGTASRAQVADFFKTRLAPYDFWLQDENKHCYALNTLVGELNGRLSPKTANLTLAMLEAGLPDTSIDAIAPALGAGDTISKEELLAAYQKFYSMDNNHPDAAKRVVNMLS